jgi:hypothetical protein
MKERKEYLALSAFLIIAAFGISSCKEDKGISGAATCGDEASANIFAPTVKIFNNIEFEDNAYHRYTKYDPDVNPGYSTFIMYLELKNICKYDVPTITASLSLNHADTTLKVKMVTQEGTEPFVVFTPPIDGLQYHTSENLELKSTYKSIDLTITCLLGFPHQGSFSADSLYYNQLVSNFYISAVYHVPL